MPPKRAVVEEDEDLDEFDAVLDKFKKDNQPSSSQPSKTNDKPPTEDPGDPDDAPLSTDDPEDLPLPDTDAGSAPEPQLPDDAQIAQLLEAFEKDPESANMPDMSNFMNEMMQDDFMKQLLQSSGLDPSALGAQPSEAPQQPQTREAPPSNLSFQESIAASVKRVNDSRRQADESTEKASASDDPISALLSQMGNLGLDNVSQDELSSIFDELMKNIVSRDLLYDPLKEMARRYPQFLDENESTLSSEDKARYTGQHELMLQVLAKLEEPGAELPDDKLTPEESKRRPERTGEIIKVIEKISDLGQPPEKILGDVPGGAEALAGVPGPGCVLM